MTVIALVHHSHARARVTDALRSTAIVRFCNTCDEARQQVFQAGVSAAIVEPEDRNGHATWPMVAAIRADFPSLPVVAYCAVRSSLSRDIVNMVRAGVDELLLLDFDDSIHRLRATLARARGTCTASWAMSELAPLVPGTLQSSLEYCLANAARSLTVDELATVLGVHRKTLVNRFARAGLPAPRTLIALSRILLATQALEDKGRPLEHIALELDFPTAGALRAMLKRYLHLSPQEVRDGEGMRCALRAFKAALRSERAAKSSDGAPQTAPQAVTLSPA